MARVQVSNRFKIANMASALQFSGSQRIVMTNMGALGSSLLGACSFGFWIKTGSRLTTPQYFFGGSNTAGGNFILLGITRTSARIGKLFFNLRDNAGRGLQVEALNESVATGKWTFVVFTKDATNLPAGMKIYINGVSQTCTTVTNGGYADPINFDRALAIGSSLGTGAVANGWVGGITHFHIFLRELTQQEITDWYRGRVVPATPFAGYLNQEGSGTAIADSQGANNGTLTINTMWSTDTPYKTRPARQF